ncbi:MAG: hypothetical protein QNL59_06125 [Actinomycetota bacterium]
MASQSMQLAPRNHFLADSESSMAHNDPAQQDTVGIVGPVGPTEAVTDRVSYSPVGPGPFGVAVSSPYPDGRRVLWANPRGRIAKFDYDTHELLSTLELEVGPEHDVDAHEEAITALDTLTGMDAVMHAASISATYLTGVTGVYYVLDCDGNYFVGYEDHVVAFGDATPGDSDSPIVVRRRFDQPPEVTGGFVGINMSYDGRLILSTENGWVISLDRDFSSYDALQLRFSEGAEEFTNARFAEFGHGGRSWMRKSLCVDEDGGIYVPSNDHMHKVVWTGSRLSTDESDGAWTEPYLNENGSGCGTTPCLMGFGNEDRFVVFGDGANVVNITLMWRDDIPEDWKQIPGTLSRRIAGFGRADMGDPSLEEIQTEQSITVCGYGAMTVNNEPASVPEGFPPAAKRLFVFWLGHHADYRPLGLHKFQWNPENRSLEHAWVNTQVSSPNAVPSVSQPSNMVYTFGSRDQQWTLEGLDWSTGESKFHYVLGSSRYNALGGTPTLDAHGRILWSGPFGLNRLENA